MARTGDVSLTFKPGTARVRKGRKEHIRAWADDQCFASEPTYEDPVEQIVYEGRVPYGLSTEHEAAE